MKLKHTCKGWTVHDIAVYKKRLSLMIDMSRSKPYAIQSLYDRVDLRAEYVVAWQS
jgi:hypothetical protein